MRLIAVVLFFAVFLPAQEPVTSRDWMNRGVQEFKAARYPEATSAFRRAVDLEPGTVTPRLYLGVAYAQQYIPGNLDPQNELFATAAESEMLRVLDLDPANQTGLSMLGSLNLNRKKWDQAEQWYRKLTGAAPSNAEAWY